MSGTRVLGVIGLDATGGLVARRALQAGSSLVVHASSAAPGALSSIEGMDFRLAGSLDELAASLCPPGALLLCLPSADPARLGELFRSALGSLGRGGLLLSSAPASDAERESLAAACAERGLAFVDLGASRWIGGRGSLALGAGGTASDWELARPFFEGEAGEGEGPGSSDPLLRLGGPGSGSLAALVRSALDGLLVELLAETYHLLRQALRASYDEMRVVLSQWNSGELADPLVAATADALGLRDEDGEPLLEKVLDAAAAAGHCSRAAALALDIGAPAPMISQAAAASALASLKDERIEASAILAGPKAALTGERPLMIEELRKAFLASTLLALSEGFSLLAAASARRGLGLDLGLAARLWSGGSQVYGRAAEALARQGGRPSILLDAQVKLLLDQCVPSLRRVAALALESGVPVPALSAALMLYDCYRATWLPANLANALRDSSQGSGYERVDRPRGELFHSEWR